MAKLVLTDPANFNATALSQMANNHNLIEAAIENTLSRDGTSPNQMEADLDMNNNDILNANVVNANSIVTDGIVLDGSIVYPTSLSTVPILDEDNFASDSAAHAPSQQSTKAFVDGRFVRHVATVAALATLPTATYTQAAVVGEGLFERVLAADYTSWIAADTLKGIIIQSTENATYAWLRVGADFLDLKWFGGVADGVDSLDYTEDHTNYADSAAFQAATIGTTTNVVRIGGGNRYRRVDQYHPDLGPELLSNGSFATDTVWTKGTGYTISAGEAHAAAGTGSNLTQAYAFVVGQAYWVNFTLTDYVAGTVSVRFFGGTTVTPINPVSANGYHSGVAVAVTGNVTFAFNKDATFAGDIDDASMKELPTGWLQSADGQFFAPDIEGRVRGTWVASKRYAKGDLAWNGGLGYKALSDHTAGSSFATDLSGGKWILGAFTGTDNTPAVAAMVAVHEATGIPMRPSSGQYRCLNPSSTVDSAYITLTGQVFDIEGRGTVWFFLDEDGTAGKNYNFWKTNTVDTNDNYRERKLFREVGMNYRGRWSHKPGGNTPNARTHVHHISGYTSLIMDSNRFEDIAGSVNRVFTCDTVKATKNFISKIAKGSLRFQDCNNGVVDGNYIEHTDDDTIDIHTSDNGIRKNWSITNNTIFDGETITGLGAASFTVTNNKQHYPHGNPFYFAAAAGTEGDNPAINNFISGNSVFNGVNRSADGSTVVALVFGAGITFGGKSADTIAGSYNGSTKIIDPIALDLYENFTDGVPQSLANSTISNMITRTRPAVAKYSHWKVGLMFYADGWMDPQITEASFLENGIVLNSDIDNFDISHNQLFGHRSGAAIMLRFISTGDARHWAFRNGRIHSNGIRDCHDGIENSITYGAAATINCDVDIAFNSIDLDPFCISPARTDLTSGTWNSGAATVDKNFAITMGNVVGIRFRGNTIRNCYEALYADTTYTRGDYENNLLICDPAADGYSASNAGIAVVYQAVNGFYHRIEECTPSSATFGQLINHCSTGAASIPTTGTYVKGHIVYRRSPAAGGTTRWIRLTTGTGHVSGTDWDPVI